jgi:hypothetical protein
VLAQVAGARWPRRFAWSAAGIDAATMNARAREENAGRYCATRCGTSAHGARPDPGRLRGEFAHVPAIVVGAGPSLDGAIPTLRALAAARC